MIWSPDNPPVSFQYDGIEFKLWMADWEKTQITGGDLKEIQYRDPKTGLVVRIILREFSDFPAAEWVVEFENKGTADTPIIEKILPLDFRLDLTQEQWAKLHWSMGSQCRMDDFQPVTQSLGLNDTLTLAPVGGRSSDGVLPFMNLQYNEGGIVLAMGWTGQWAASFERSREGICITGGMERTHLCLHPGEKIRTPRILLINWAGRDPFCGNNLLRRIILKHYTPEYNGEKILPPVAHMTMSTYHTTKVVSEEREMKTIARAAELGVEAYWIDACWYGKTQDWSKEVGTWKINPNHFPNGLRPIGDAAHDRRMKFVVWFEPERVQRDSELEITHPEFLLKSSIDRMNFLYNLGLPEARKYMTDLLSGFIREWGVDIYRQDFNFEPLLYWQEADAEDRVGMTEIRHIEGLYAMWDELRRRHPGLAIDNCASGGRRIDLETTRRSFPLWRSDFSDVGGPKYGQGLHIGDQLQTAGLSRWVPLHTAAVWTFTPYAFRSAMSTGIVPYCNIREETFPLEQAKKAIAELKSLRPFFLGDFYPLFMELTTDPNAWCAYQFDRPDLGEGFAVYLRRHESQFVTMEAYLKGLDPVAVYEVGVTSTFDVPPRQRMSGADLLHFKITIEEKPGSMLLRYKKVQ
jgi:alpha-galactosidase